MSGTWFRYSLLAAAAVAAFNAQAETLKEATQKAVLRNPEVQARWHSFKEATENIDVARGGYYPKADLSAGVFRERLDEPGRSAETFTRRGVTLQLNQMLFDGFATRSEVKRLSYAQRTRYYELLEASENTAQEVARAYNDVLRYRKLHKLAQDNYVAHRATFDQIQRRVQAGVARGVDLEQVSGRLALAESNMVTEASNLHDVSRRYQRLVGELPPTDMAEPAPLKAGVPATAKEALIAAYQQNPALAASMENIVSAQAGAEGTRARFMPRVDLRAKKDLGWDVEGIDGRTDLTSVGVVLNWNLYNGGSDKATERQYWERVNIAKDLRDKTCRDVRQTLSIAHHDIGRLEEQKRYLDTHQLTTEKVMEAYRRQFDIGQRSLLDLLDTENELFQARRAYVNAEQDQASAYARTQASMGSLLATLGLQRLDTPGLSAQDEKAEFDPATVCPPDEDGRVSVDKDKLYADYLATRPQPAPPITVAPPKPMTELEKAKPGDVVILKGVNFEFDSARLRPDALPILDAAVATLKQRTEIDVLVVGHTDSVGTEAYNQRLSERRAKSVMDYLVSKGVAAERLSSKGFGETKPIASNKTEEGRAQNRRVELHVLDEKARKGK